MATYRHNVRNIQARTINGHRITMARLFDEGDYVRWEIHNTFGQQFVDGGNFRSVEDARRSLHEAIDPIKKRLRHG